MFGSSSLSRSQRRSPILLCAFLTLLACLAFAPRVVHAQVEQSDDPFFVDAGPESPSALVLTSTGACPGIITLTATGATPGARVGFAYGFTPGSTPVGPCPGLSVDIAGAALAGVATADVFGTASISGFVPAGACGSVLAQAVEVPLCTKSNRVTIGDTVVRVALPAIGGGISAGPFCQYTALADCSALGILNGDTICVRCVNQTDTCPGWGTQRVTMKIYKADCETLICEFLASPDTSECSGCNSTHNYERCP